MLRVPFVDVLSSMRDPTLPLTTLEYSEWGDPSIPAEVDVTSRRCSTEHLTGGVDLELRSNIELGTKQTMAQDDGRHAL